MSDPGIGTSVRYWLHYGNLASSFFKQFGAVRKIRDDYEKQIINTLQQNGMEKAVIQINNGRIQMVEKKEPNQLSLTRVEEMLHGYFKHKGGKDETVEIMTFIKANRGYNINKILKQSGMPPAPSQNTPKLM
uniref:Uncharacterized protein n=1 Tax=viral metagenome TaxID=1070528 RepID=A0A6C0KW79_9ZZZZ